MATSVSEEWTHKTDMLFKAQMGRLGFDASRPWYEEEHFAPPLVPVTSVMSQPLPERSKLPGLMQGGRVWVDGGDAGFDSSANPVAQGATVTMRLRVPLRAVQTYAAAEGGGSFVFVAADGVLSRSCPSYGYVVESLVDGHAIDVVREPYFVMNGHVVFEGMRAPTGSQFYVSFYEYTGPTGLRAAAAAASGEAAAASAAAAAGEADPPAPRDSDGLQEGVFNLFYTEARFRTSFLNMTTDDLPKGAATAAAEASHKPSHTSHFDA